MPDYASWADAPFDGDLGVTPMDGVTPPSLTVLMDAANIVIPYNYLPFFAAPTCDPGLGQHESPGHQRWVDGSYSGTIELKWTAERPIIAGVLSRIGDHGIAIHDVPRTPDRHPDLPGTATRGPLRNLYAAITGSRLDVSPGRSPLLYRIRPTSQHASVVKLARVAKHPESSESLVLEVSDIPVVDVMPHGQATVTSTIAVPYHFLKDVVGTTAKGHGTASVRIRAWLELVHHEPRGNQAPYYYWRVASPLTRADSLTLQSPPVTGSNDGAFHKIVREHPLVLVEGQVHASGERTFGRKHDERLWVSCELARAPYPGSAGPSTNQTVQLTTRVTLTGDEYLWATDAWGAVLRSYIGAEPPQGVQPAIYTKEEDSNRWQRLDEGQTLFYRTRSSGNQTLHVFTPGLVSRESYAIAPEQLIDDALRPPTTPAEMTAVQRVFGTVTEGDDEGRGAGMGRRRSARRGPSFAYKALCEFGGLTCENITLPDPHGNPWTLAAQGAPKPGYGRFTTVGEDGARLDNVAKPDLFRANHGLAGRRIALHHAQSPERPPADGWAFDPQRTEPTPAAYLVGPETKASQVIQITGWVPRGAEFTQTLRFRNLSSSELGALLWLLDKPRYHHIGRARAFGFGTVTVKRLATKVQDADLRRADLRRLAPPADQKRYLSAESLDALRNDFDQWLTQHGPTTRRAVLDASIPYAGVRYPTLDEYGANERNTARRALPMLGRTNPDKRA